MTQKILVIGGTRFLGRHLVADLLAAGHRVTIASRGRAADGLGDRVARIAVDRRDARAFRVALAGRGDFDLVVDQVVYSPLDVAGALDALAGRAGRFVMTSTIEVYRALAGRGAPHTEDAVDLSTVIPDSAIDWHDDDGAEARYARGKIEAEALLARETRLPCVAVRLAHVLGGPQDFTGRLAHHVALVRDGRPLRRSPSPARTSFLTAPAAATGLAWAGAQSFTGPVNLACAGSLSALELHRRVAAILQRPATHEVAPPGAATSPFDVPDDFRMDTTRAETLGLRLPALDDALPALVDAHAVDRTAA